MQTSRKWYSTMNYWFWPGHWLCQRKVCCTLFAIHDKKRIIKALDGSAVITQPGIIFYCKDTLGNRNTKIKLIEVPKPASTHPTINDQSWSLAIAFRYGYTRVWFPWWRRRPECLWHVPLHIVGIFYVHHIQVIQVSDDRKRKGT